MSEYDNGNVELQAPTNIFREVLIAVQNSSPLDLVVTTFSVSAGYWDSAAPSGVPTQGFQISPGQTPTWGNYTGTPFTSVSGSMTINSSGTGTVVLNWTWNYGSTATATQTITVAGIKATVTLGNPGSSSITATYSISAA